MALVGPNVRVATASNATIVPTSGTQTAIRSTTIDRADHFERHPWMIGRKDSGSPEQGHCCLRNGQLKHGGLPLCELLAAALAQSSLAAETPDCHEHQQVQHHGGDDHHDGESRVLRGGPKGHRTIRGAVNDARNPRCLPRASVIPPKIKITTNHMRKAAIKEPINKPTCFKTCTAVSLSEQDFR